MTTSRPEDGGLPVTWYLDFYRAACNADAVLWWEFCPSLRPSVTRV